MKIYCSHKYGGDEKNIKLAEQKIRKLALEDLENTYISPLHCFRWLKYDEIDYELEMMMCLDLLEGCDMVYVLSDTSEGIEWELSEAKRMKKPIKYIKEFINESN